MASKFFQVHHEFGEGITAEEFQEFIDALNGVNLGLGAWMNICKEINLELAGNPPYVRALSRAIAGGFSPQIG